MAEQPIGNLKGTNSIAGDKVPQHVSLVDTSGNIIESFGGTGGTASTDGAVFTPNTTAGTPAMGAYQSAPSAVTDGDVAIIGIDVNRNVKVNVVAGGTAGAQYTEGDIDATITGTALMMEGAADTLVAATGTAANGLDVDVTRVSGTVTVDGSGVTQPVSHAALTELAAAIDTEVQVDIVGALPTGGNAIGTVAVTAVTPGTAATSLGKAEDAGHSTGDVGVMALAVRFDAGGAIAGTDLDYTPLQVDANGALRVTGGGGGTEYTQGDVDATITGGAVLAEGPADALTPLLVDASQHLQVDVAAFSASPSVTNAGTFVVQENGAALTALQVMDDWDETDRAKVNIIVAQAGITAAAGVVAGNTPRVTLASNDPAVTSLQLIDDAIFAEDVAATPADKGMAVLAVRRDADTSLVGADNDYANLQVDATGRLKVVTSDAIADDAAFTPGASLVSMAGFTADETATDSVNEGDAGAARMTLDRKVIVTPQPHTAGGCSAFYSLDLDETEEAVKASAGQVYGFYFTNRTTSPLYLKFYNDTVANVVVGTTAPLMTFELPSNATDHIAGIITLPLAVEFSAAITVAVTTGFADNDTGAPGANHAIVAVFYK